MQTKFASILIISSLLVCTSYAQKPRTATPEDIIRQLNNSNYKIAFEGLYEYLRLPPDQRTAEMKTALVQVLKNENERHRQLELRRQATGRYLAAYESEGEGEALIAMHREVFELKDPATIPILLPSLCCGWTDEMVDFGRQAFEPVLRFVEAPQPGTTVLEIGGALSTLRMMVDYWGLRTFDATERERMKQVAAKYIVGHAFPPMINAIYLAASLRDPALIRMAHALVHSDVELAKREIEYFRGQLQETASEALAGTLKMRQYVPYRERKRCEELGRFPL